MRERINTVKKIEAYQTSDGKKFTEKDKAQIHEDRLRYKLKTEYIEHYLFNLLGIEKLSDDEDGEDQGEQLSNMLMDEGISGFWNNAGELDAIIELIVDIATIHNGALLKTALYAKRVTSSSKDSSGDREIDEMVGDDRKIDKIMDILLEYDRDIANGYDFSGDAEDMLKPIAEKILKAVQYTKEVP